jgi:hypothetical protein
MKFEDVGRLDDRAIREMLRRFLSLDYLDALREADDRVVFKILKNADYRAFRAYVRRVILDFAPRSREEVAAARSQVLEMIAELEGEGAFSDLGGLKSCFRDEDDSRGMARLRKSLDEIVAVYARFQEGVRKTLSRGEASRMGKPGRYALEEIPPLIYYLSLRAMRGGLLSLEHEADRVEDDLVREGLDLILEGIDPDRVSAILQHRLEASIREERVRGTVIIDSILAIQRGDQVDLIEKSIDSIVGSGFSRMFSLERLFQRAFSSLSAQ